MSSKTRKYDSGYEKRKKKKGIEDLTRSQKGALDKFIVKDGNSNDNVNMDEDIDKVADNVPLVDETGTHNCDIPTENIPIGENDDLIDILAVKGPKRDLSIENGHKDKGNRHFSSKHYTRILSNGKK
ncbi:uncharacterized protein LOC141630314 [Silene latifolia]|uniref:uncharacterized protein LOC141630314 n=1 Tax=Silene latifolia TaxID=37657 RepID=UPI003D788958